MMKYIIVYGFPGTPKYIHSVAASFEQANVALFHIDCTFNGAVRTELIPVKS